MPKGGRSTKSASRKTTKGGKKLPPAFVAQMGKGKKKK